MDVSRASALRLSFDMSIFDSTFLADLLQCLSKMRSPMLRMLKSLVSGMSNSFLEL